MGRRAETTVRIDQTATSGIPARPATGDAAAPAPLPEGVGEGRRRAVVERVTPQVEGGRYPAKRVAGEDVEVEADVFADGHDQLAAVLRYRREEDREWSETPMRHVENDRWRGSFVVPATGRYRYEVRAWIDRFGTWRGALAKKAEAGQDVRVELMAGVDLVTKAQARAHGPERRRLRAFARTIREGSDPEMVKGLLGKARLETRDAALRAALDPELAELMERHPDRRFAVTSEPELPVLVDRERARFSTWYELFPRSASAEPGRHGTFSDVEGRLPYVKRLGFDVLYFPPIHPIGRTHRKGRNNSPEAKAGDPGSPWAIGGPEGGHKAVDPRLGTLEDFDRLVEAANGQGIEIALDLAYQCSPDHPWVEEHPEWFRHRPDGTIQYAENPPKKYEDIYPLDFETDAWRELWAELKSVVDFWIGHGVRIFRVDNPHTKAFRFWEWMIGEVKEEHPDVIFLSEAFTRPKVMYRLAKLGFTKSYTYFAWRATKWEITEYFTELTRTEVREFFRANLWPNTPDIVTEPMQTGGRPTFVGRLILAATLGASYGIYGPAFELMEHVPVAQGKEEYRNSEKYEIRHWDLEREDSLAELITLVNGIRRENPALQTDRTLRFHTVDGDHLICYSKITPDRENAILVVVNLDPEHRHGGMVHLDLAELGVERDRPYQVHDLLTGARFLWQGPDNYVELNPHVVPAHILRVRHHVRTERDFETYQ
jgi:starch synthase (maltosyl-transferring)